MTIASERQTAVAGELRHVHKWYGDHHVLTDVSVRVVPIGKDRDERLASSKRTRDYLASLHGAL